MSCPNQSLVPVSADKVAKAATKLRDHVVTHRAELRNASVEWVLANRTVGWWFHKRPVTLEEANHIVDNEEEFGGWPVFHDHLWYGDEWSTRANQLLAAVALCQSGTIYLSLKDAELVQENSTPLT